MTGEKGCNAPRALRAFAQPGDGSVDDALRPEISRVRAARRPEEMLPPTLHPAVEGPPIREVEVRHPRLPLGAKEGGGDRIRLAMYSPIAAIHSSLASTSKRASYRAVRARSRMR